MTSSFPPDCGAPNHMDGCIEGEPNLPVLGSVQMPPNFWTSLKSKREGPSARLDLDSTLSIYTEERSEAARSQNSPAIVLLSSFGE